ncbi:MAG: N-acetyl-gamma-glutamyl-phosphate reductase [Oscillospiraceae bacterium]
MKVFIDGSAGTTGLQIYGRLEAREDIELMTLSDEARKDPSARKEALNSCDIAFLCLPDDAARQAVSLIENPDVRVIDASTAHRTADGWTYGFPELKGQREKIAGSKRVANPGCYATGFISLIRPLVETGTLPADSVIACHALSGYTGGGKKTIAEYESPERDVELDSPRHYGVSLNHKHIPEMMAVSGLTRKPLFSPIICDYPQGMVVTVLIDMGQLNGGRSIGAVRNIYSDYYAGSAVVELRPEDAPSCGFMGSNNLAGRDILQIFVCGNESQLMLSARLDNLGKGASGAAVQNMNILMGADETTGLVL